MISGLYGFELEVTVKNHYSNSRVWPSNKSIESIIINKLSNNTIRIVWINLYFKTFFQIRQTHTIVDWCYVDSFLYIRINRIFFRIHGLTATRIKIVCNIIIFKIMQFIIRSGYNNIHRMFEIVLVIV